MEAYFEAKYMSEFFIPAVIGLIAVLVFIGSWLWQWLSDKRDK